MPAAATTVLIAGATGYIGRRVVTELMNRGHRVVALLRARPDAEMALHLEGCDVRITSLADAQEIADALSGLEADAVVSCIASRSGAPKDAWLVDYEANRNLLAAARALGATRFVLLSAICVQKPELEFQKAKLAFEAELAASGVDYSIVRPTAFFKSLSGQVARVQAGRPYLVFGDGQGTACKPISDRDLARFLVLCLTDPDKRNTILPIGGPGPAITPLDQAHHLFRLLSQTPRIRHVPYALLDGLVGSFGLLGRVSQTMRDKAEFARTGRYYGTQSMLLWNDAAGRYDADATPEYGSDTLWEHYEALVQGRARTDLGAHAVY